MRERIDNRRLGVEGRKFVLFTNNLPRAASVLNLFDVWDANLMVVGTKRVYKQISELCPQFLKTIEFRLLRNIDCDVLYHDVKAFKPDYVMTFLFLSKLPTRLFTLASRLAFNFHPSLLPYYKGGAPYTKPLENNDEIFGYSVHELTSEFDEGVILHQIQKPVRVVETEYSLIMQAGPLAVEALKTFLPKLEKDALDAFDNPNDLPLAKRRRFKEFWFNPALNCDELERLTRARNIQQGPQVNIQSQRPKGPAFMPLRIHEVLIRRNFPEEVLAMDVGQLMLVAENAYVKVGDGVLEITVVTHPEFGIMSMKRYCQIEGVAQQQPVQLIFPGDVEGNKPLADKLAEWYYRELNEKFSPDNW